MRRTLALAALTVFSLAACSDEGFGGDSVHQTVHQQFVLAANAHVHVGNVSGFIDVIPWNRNEIDITARKHSDSLDALQRTSIEITHEGSPATDVEIETHYAHRGFFFWGGSGADVDYTIHVPKEVALRLSDVSGDIRLNGTIGDVDVNNVSGDVTATHLDGDLHVHTISGSIEASEVRLAGDRTIDIEAISGSVHLSIPKSSSAQVNAESISGDFNSDFDIPTRHHTVGVSAEGRIGSGSGTIEIKTISGSMTISKM